jgi:hypothetical protein
MLKKVAFLTCGLIVGLILYLVVTTPPEFKAQQDPVANCPTSVFDKSALVFDAILICATSGVPPAKLEHATNVTAEWLDNDEDGTVDDPRLLETLKRNKPVVVMTFDGMPLIPSIRLFSAFSEYSAQDLGAEETGNPERRDASQEEIHHLIMNAGWQKLYPTVFSEDREDESDLYGVWKYANDQGYYSYGDPTCDDSCKVTEFVYLATAAYLGSKADLFSDELTLKTRDSLREVLPEVVEIFESDAYVYPRNHWPDGDYPHKQHTELFGVSR